MDGELRADYLRENYHFKIWAMFKLYTLQWSQMFRQKLSTN